jgi:hypothetical protein
MTPLAKLIGRVDTAKFLWYTLEDGTSVSFHTAFLDEERTKSIVFMADGKTWPSIAAQELGISYTFLRNSTLPEMKGFVERNEIKLK